jgi:hypothetical protein
VRIRNKVPFAPPARLVHLDGIVRKLRTYFSLRARQGKSACSLVALALFVFVQTLAASSAIHHFVHHDADQPNHQCAATLLSQGQVSAASVEVSVSPPVAIVSESALPSVRLTVAVEYRLLPERAPPSLHP